MISTLSILCIIGQLSGPNVSYMLGNTMIGIFEKTEEIRETYEVKPGTALTVSNANGDIRLEAWDKSYLEIRAVKKTHHGEDELAKVQIDIDVAEEITVQTRHLEKNVRVSVDYYIKTPDELSVKKLFTSNGDIECVGTTGNIETVTSNGDVDLKNINGTVNVKTSNGDIDIKDTKVVRAAKTSNGDVRAEIHNVPDSGIEIVTSNGSIDLYVDVRMNADLNVATSMGKVSVKDVEVRSKLTARTETATVLKGTIGSGGRMINAHTANGDIVLHRLGG